MSDDGELGLGLKVRREHLLVHTLALRRAAILVIVVIFLGTAIEISWDLVLVRLAVLSR